MTKRRSPFTSHQVIIIAKAMEAGRPYPPNVVALMIKEYALCLRREEEAALQEL